VAAREDRWATLHLVEVEADHLERVVQEGRGDDRVDARLGRLRGSSIQR
jgi:hypothetical protein